MQAALVYFGSLIFLICASMVQAPGSARASDHDAEVLPEVQIETVVDDYQRPEIQRDLDALPFPARRMHELLIEAAASGEIDRLRPYIGQGEDATLLSFGDTPEDPITFLKSLSGDSEGHEILAILQEVLETGFVRVDPDTDNELYVWPYFYRVPLEELDSRQRVELYRLLTHGDYEEMAVFGTYIFYRVGITPQGRWRFFVAGD